MQLKSLGTELGTVNKPSKYRKRREANMQPMQNNMNESLESPEHKEDYP